ncbi:MAG: hypothetical protein H0V17_06415 [Deltaproteobacteria bacterium]|nr:hypothetical protein [Deltaproteobacteria bacterium]
MSAIAAFGGLTAAVAVGVACNSPPPPPPPPSPCATPEPFHSGQATHYTANGTGQCSFDRRVGRPLLVAAINGADYEKSARCGSCLVVVGPDEHEILVEIVDHCPGCKPGSLDLSRDAFALLAPLERGRIPIRWLPVPCDVEGPLTYHFKPGSNPSWAAIQIRNHRYPIAAVDARNDRGTFTSLSRASYNYFVGKALGAGPYTLRVTDSRGQTHVDTGVVGPDHAGSAQLPRCP